MSNLAASAGNSFVSSCYNRRCVVLAVLLVLSLVGGLGLTMLAEKQRPLVSPSDPQHQPQEPGLS